LAARLPRGWVLSLEGEWFGCGVNHNGGSIWVSGASKGIMGGMSGLPILGADGKAIGLISCSGGVPGSLHTEGGPTQG
jgi:hypothetical protein